MEYGEIRDLAALMKEMGLTVLEYSGDGTSVRMERAASQPAVGSNAQYTQERPEEKTEEFSAAGVITIRSPMVGLFYAAPGSEKEPYVTAGDTVRAGDVLCIIEAMKIMNEITAEQDGIIVEICAGDKQLVEYGQPLFRVDTTQA